MPTDTIYGIVGQAQNISTVNRVYNIKKRNPEKPFIILISGISDLQKFSINLSMEEIYKLDEFWPGPISVILECPGEEYNYLTRNTKTLAFRMPQSEKLRELIGKTGPLIAPSANPEGFAPAKNISEAKKYFGESVDFYLNGGEIQGNASKIIRLHKDGSIIILRA